MSLKLPALFASTFCLTCVLFASQPARAQDLKTDVVAALQTGAEAWNRGDLDAFMKGYVESPELTYTASGRVVRGWEALHKRYADTYGGSKDSMGQLRFDEIEVTPLGSDYALALGRWSVAVMQKRPIGGVFSLVLRRTPDGWRILHDHTSTGAEQKKTAN